MLIYAILYTLQVVFSPLYAEALNPFRGLEHDELLHCGGHPDIGWGWCGVGCEEGEGKASAGTLWSSPS